MTSDCVEDIHGAGDLFEVPEPGENWLPFVGVRSPGR